MVVPPSNYPIYFIKMSSITESLMKFDDGLKLYMARDGKKITGITLRKRSFWPVFDVASDALPVAKARKGIVYQHLDNLFNRLMLGRACKPDPNILKSLFIAEGTSADMSLQTILEHGWGGVIADAPVSNSSSASAIAPAPSNSSASTQESAPSRGIEDAIRHVQSLCDAARLEQEKLEQLQFLVNTWKAHQTKIAALRLSLKEYL
jgi:hypothetical protein